MWFDRRLREVLSIVGDNDVCLSNNGSGQFMPVLDCARHGWNQVVVARYRGVWIKLFHDRKHAIHVVLGCPTVFDQVACTLIQDVITLQHTKNSRARRDNQHVSNLERVEHVRIVESRERHELLPRLLLGLLILITTHLFG